MSMFSWMLQKIYITRWFCWIPIKTTLKCCPREESNACLYGSYPRELLFEGNFLCIFHLSMLSVILSLLSCPSLDELLTITKGLSGSSLYPKAIPSYICIFPLKSYHSLACWHVHHSSQCICYIILSKHLWYFYSRLITKSWGQNIL